MEFLKPFHFPFPNICLKDNLGSSFFLGLSSIFVHAVCSIFHLALLLSTFALPLFFRSNSTHSETNTKAQLKEEEEEPITVEERNDKVDQDSGSDLTEEWSDGSISDEESLIEIALPSGYYIDSKKQEPPLARRCCIEQKWWSECYKFEYYKQQSSLMAELLAEINEFYEEDNMIEIDLSMGSIKCPRFEITA